MRFHPKYIQLAGDALIPVLGFFTWNWNLYFILIFYFLDLLTKEILLHLKSKKISRYIQQSTGEDKKEEKWRWRKMSSISCIIFFFSVFLVQISMPFIQPGFDSASELISFWKYKDVGGIEQGYILVPLIVFMGYTQYKMEFLKPAVYSRLSMNKLWQPHIHSLLVILAFTGFSFGLVQFVLIPEWFFVVSIVLFSSLYQLFILNKK